MVLKDIIRIYNHPLNRKRKALSLFKYFKLGLYMRIFKNKMFAHNYLHGTKLLVGKKSTSSLGQYFNGLNDFEEMSLLLHFLNESDLFVDIGANVGVYSILASGVAKSSSIAIEPSTITSELLRENIKINNLENKISHVKCIVGNETKKIAFTAGKDATNRVALSSEKNINTELLDIDTLDNILNDKSPKAIKIDVEGFEVNILKGASKVLQNPDLKILFIETNGNSAKYKLDENEIFSILNQYGFEPYVYHPLSREFSIIEKDSKSDNTIFIRDISFIEDRVKHSKKITYNDIKY